MRMEESVPPRRTSLRRARASILRMLFAGSALLICGPLFAYLGLNYSGRLALAQKISGGQVARGFDFGPVYLEQGVTGRYFISATVPKTAGGAWHTRFEVLNEQRTPIYRQDELRFLGEYKFSEGERDRYHKQFQLEEATGYYYFRFTAVNGEYDANPNAPPVVEFAVRQGVLHGLSLWLPALGMVVAGVLFIWRAIALIRRMGARGRERRAAWRHGGAALWKPPESGGAVVPARQP